MAGTKDQRLKQLTLREFEDRIIEMTAECCAQQTGMHILVVEALLIALYLPEGRADTYKHKEILLPPSRHLPPIQLVLPS
jgi:hypothetical protein